MKMRVLLIVFVFFALAACSSNNKEEASEDGGDDLESGSKDESDAEKIEEDVQVSSDKESEDDSVSESKDDADEESDDKSEQESNGNAIDESNESNDDAEKDSEVESEESEEKNDTGENSDTENDSETETDKSTEDDVNDGSDEGSEDTVDSQEAVPTDTSNNSIDDTNTVDDTESIGGTNSGDDEGTDTGSDTEVDTGPFSECPWVEPDDLGNTGDAVAGELIEFNNNGSWCWYQDERAVIDVEGGKLVVASVASGGARDGDIEAVVYDLESGQKQQETLNSDADLWMDDHNAPAVAVLPNGNYLAVYAGHNHENNYKSYYRTYSGGSWGSESIFDWRTEMGANYTTTYSNLWYLSAEDKVINIARTNDKSPNLMVSEDNGQSWSYGGQLTSSEGTGYVNGYFKYWGNGVDRIDFVGTQAHPRDEPNCSLFHGYIKGGQTYNSEDTVMDENISDQQAPQIKNFTSVFQSGTTVGGTRITRAWNIDIQRYDDGTIAVLFKGRANDSESDHRFAYARFDGTSWKSTYLGKAGNKLYSSEQDYVGLGALDPDNPEVLYISTPFDPRNDTTQLGQREIFKGVTCDNGATFNWTPITANSSSDNLRPIVPKWNSRNTALIWMKGIYHTAQDIDAAIVGVISHNP